MNGLSKRREPPKNRKTRPQSASGFCGRVLRFQLGQLVDQSEHIISTENLAAGAYPMWVVLGTEVPTRKVVLGQVIG